MNYLSDGNNKKGRRIMFKVKDKLGTEYDCYQFITSGDGRVYGVCYHKGGSSFELIPYEDIKPVTDKTLNENNTTKF